MTPRTEEAARFWAKVDRRGPRECWPWLAGTFRSGYGAIGISKPRRMIYAHRMAYALSVGIDIRDLDVEVVMHSCDNQPCCNPAHLREGTHADNVRDMDEKDRRVSGDRRGERNSKARLSEDDIREIRSRLRLGRTQREIAENFCVSKSAISHIAARRTWNHV